MAMTAFLAGTLLLLLSGVPGLFLSRRSAAGERIALALVWGGALLGGGGVASALLGGETPSVSLPWGVPGGSFSLALDGISAVFLLPVYFVSALGALYGLGYWPQRERPGSGRKLRLFYGLIAGALTLVLTARNAVLFLAAWEAMALAGFFLVSTEEGREEARRAGFLYLTATHLGTLALFALFIVLAGSAGSFDFPGAGALPAGAPAGTAVFLLALVGFGLKAGLMPLHVWLPGAHAAAPSHVSALLSGVMIKSGIYGLVRVTGFFADLPPWWGWTLLALGGISAAMGVAFALAQHDLKRLLAYHSVENIGIIALGLGAALLGKSFALPSMTVLGLAGALLHVINHGLFKSLLFLGAGSVIHASGTRELNRYGGLLRPMPWTGLCFLGGAAAISALPPLNGFVSEWLVYLGLLQSVRGEGAALAVFAVPLLALVGGLALACFVKVVGVAFLGEPRTSDAAVAREAPASMLLPMGGLLLACAAVGVFPAAVMPLLSRAAGEWGGADPSPLSSGLPAVGWVTGSALALLALAALGALALRGRKGGARGSTWGCGYAFPSPRMQYSASSFAETLVKLFRWALRTDAHGGEAAGVLPGEAAFASHTPDTVLDRLVLPLLRRAARGCAWARSRLQNGMIGLYLLYVLLVLCALLALTSFPGSPTP